MSLYDLYRYMYKTNLQGFLITCRDIDCQNINLLKAIKTHRAVGC